jgi:hypothetical protein
VSASCMATRRSSCGCEARLNWTDHVREEIE